MSRNALIVLVIVLVIAFIAGVGVGFARDDNDFDLTSADWAGWIESRLPSNTVTTDDIDRATPLDCLDAQRDELFIAANGQCRLIIESARGQRTLELKLVEGDSAEIILTQPIKRNGDTLKSDKTIRVGESAEIDIFRRQSADDQIQAVIVCRSLNNETCRLQFP